MTREEAIHFAECLKHNWTIDFNDMEDFCDMAIEALSEPSGDLISRADAIEAVGKIINGKAYWEDILAMKDALSALPSAEAVEAIHDTEWVALRRNEYEDLLASTEAVQGEWIKDGQFWMCSECGTRIFSESYMDRQIYHAFCSRCGARMGKGGDDE